MLAALHTAVRQPTVRGTTIYRRHARHCREPHQTHEA